MVSLGNRVFYMHPVYGQCPADVIGVNAQGVTLHVFLPTGSIVTVFGPTASATPGNGQYGDSVSPLWADYIMYRGVISPRTTGTLDTTHETFPAGVLTNTNSIIISDLEIHISQALVGSGHITITVGKTAGGTEYLASFQIDNTVLQGKVVGLLSAEWGTAFDPASGNALADGASSVISRCVATGSITTPPIINLRFNGMTVA